ncbi:putative oxidoreductase [Tetragenococcus halophilus subsp. halophilus]|uniref:Putative oxidoreductase n=2 Tax=Tetragenococcus halophilus TaxID=51669 RepID=A0A2H6CWQ6_TETHA|nr:putative oxidoreductase [Tetragenococcus halophilus subsp. halophilus]GBD69427.1 putative oxidoreductase [Tetragenococcus halophilus subsp. halophilus]GBD77798.1 putative oxidoreductase [Tetragenococcus halophilus subsp. halophilus]
MVQTMKAMGISQYKQEKLEELTLPIPEISENEVLVEIVAASINPIDLKIRDGKLKMLLHYDMPLVLGNDFAGRIVKAGDKVTNFKVGDEVYGRPQKTKIGTFAEYIGIDQEDIALKPKNLTFEEAASIPLVGLTSYQALHDIMQVQSGDKVLIQAGSGGIGTIAIQLAKLMDVYVATTASDRGKELVTRLSADQVINYREENFAEVLSDYDDVFDTLGGQNLSDGFKVLKPGGKIVTISGTPNARFGKEYGVGWFKTMLFGLASFKLTRLEKQYDVNYHFLFMKPSGEQLEILCDYIEDGKLEPIVDRVFSFEKTQEAVEYSASGHAKGKIIIKINKWN